MTFDELAASLDLSPAQSLAINHWLADRVLTVHTMRAFPSEALRGLRRVQSLRRYKKAAVARLVRFVEEHAQVEERPERAGEIDVRVLLSVWVNPGPEVKK